MPINLQMPALSPTMEEGTLAKWLVKEGDQVSSGDLLAEIETDKATMEFEAIDEGVIAKIVVAEGTDNVKVGEIIAIIAEEGEDAGDAKAAEPAPAPTPAPAPAAKENPAPAPTKSNDGIKVSPAARRIAEAKGIDLSGITGTGPDGKIVKGDLEGLEGSGDAAPAPIPAPAPVAAAPSASGARVKATPLARRLAKQKGIDIATLTGTGPNGRVIKADIEAAKTGEGVTSAPATTAPAPAAQAAAIPDTEIPHTDEKLSNMRKTIARRLTGSMQDAPHIYLTVDVQLDALLALRKELNDSLESRGVKLSVNDMVIKALAIALEQVPECNVSFLGDQLRRYERQDISVAVSIPGGLITPVITDAANKTLSKIATETKDLASRAQEGKLQPHEYMGGTASVSNMGMMGIKQFTAVINPPQSMILAVGAGEKRPHVIDDSLQIATVMTVTGSFDHRAIDGADGAKLLAAFKALVEKPLGMLA